MNNYKEDSCGIYFRVKQTPNQFPISNSNAKDVFDLIHCDIWGPYRTPSLSGAYYFLSIVDDASSATWVYLMKYKSEARKLLKGFIPWLEINFIRELQWLEAIMGPTSPLALCNIFILNMKFCMKAVA